MTVMYLLISFPGGSGGKYLAAVGFVEEVDNLFDSFGGTTYVGPGKTLNCLLSDDSHHIGYWNKAVCG